MKAIQRKRKREKWVGKKYYKARGHMIRIRPGVFIDKKGKTFN